MIKFKLVTTYKSRKASPNNGHTLRGIKVIGAQTDTISSQYSTTAYTWQEVEQRLNYDFCMLLGFKPELKKAFNKKLNILKKHFKQ